MLSTTTPQRALGNSTPSASGENFSVKSTQSFFVDKLVSLKNRLCAGGQAASNGHSEDSKIACLLIYTTISMGQFKQEDMEKYLREVDRIYSKIKRKSSRSFYIAALGAVERLDCWGFNRPEIKKMFSRKNTNEVYRNRKTKFKYTFGIKSEEDFYALLEHDLLTHPGKRELIKNLKELAAEMGVPSPGGEGKQEAHAERVAKDFYNFILSETYLNASKPENVTKYIDKIRAIYSKIENKSPQNFYLTVIYVEQSLDDTDWDISYFHGVLKEYPLMKNILQERWENFSKLMEKISLEEVIAHVEPLECDTPVGHGNGLRYGEVYVRDLLGFLDASKGELNSIRFIGSPVIEKFTEKKRIIEEKIDDLKDAIQGCGKESVHLRIDKHELNRELYEKKSSVVDYIDEDGDTIYKDEPSKELRGELKAIALGLSQLRKGAPITGAENKFLLDHFNKLDFVEIFGANSRTVRADLSSGRMFKSQMDAGLKQRFASAAAAAASAAGVSAASPAAVVAEATPPAATAAPCMAAGGGDGVTEGSADKKCLGDLEHNKTILIKFSQMASEKLGSIPPPCFPLFACHIKKKKTNLHKKIEGLEIALGKYSATSEGLGRTLEAIGLDLNNLRAGAGDELFSDNFHKVTKVAEMKGKLSTCIESSSNPISNGARFGAVQIHPAM